jgi:3-oxoacyl-[acyl-carrier protein] reductase
MNAEAAGRTILITGTTSGLGRALLDEYDREGVNLIGVNRRDVADLHTAFPRARFFVADITQPSEVARVFEELRETGTLPDVVILNAGINEVDYDSRFDFGRFKSVLDVNLAGVLTFVHCIHRMDKPTTIVGISSTSTIVPNSSNLGYYVSKLSLNALFRLFAMSDRKNRYKVVMLGPVHTLLNRNLPAQTGVQKSIFEFLSLEPASAARRCARFVESRSRVLHPPLLTAAFYWALKVALVFVPSLYYRSK